MYRFDTIRKDPETGDVILSAKPTTWDSFFAALRAGPVSADFMDAKERNQEQPERDPFDDFALGHGA